MLKIEIVSFKLKRGFYRRFTHFFIKYIWTTNGAFNKNINAGFYHSLHSALFTCSVALNFKSSLLAILSSIVREWQEEKTISVKMF